jgi:hypothetical protein
LPRDGHPAIVPPGPEGFPSCAQDRHIDRPDVADLTSFIPTSSLAATSSQVRPSAAHDYRRDMDDRANSDGIGELTLADTTLGELLKEILQSVSGSEWQPNSTTNRAADHVRNRVKKKPHLFPDEVSNWLDRIQSAMDERNEVVHAAAVDRCRSCGRATRFRHKDSPIDRSPERVRRLIQTIDSLTAEGVELAREISGRINADALRGAQARAAETGKPQSPPQLLIGQTWHECASCSGTGHPQTTVSAPSAVAVLPPGTDIAGLFGPAEES